MISNNGPGPSVKNITIIHFALLAGMVLFAAVAFAVGKPFTTQINTTDPLLIAVPVLAVSCLFISNLLYKKFLAGAVEANDVPGKLVGYQTAFIIRNALIEGPALFAIVAFLLSGSVVFIAIAIALILYFFSLRPTKDKIAEELQLSYEQKLEL